MPSDPFVYEYRDESKRIAAWQAHYMAKGCTSTKAYDVARRKVWRSWTWPRDPARCQSGNI